MADGEKARARFMADVIADVEAYPPAGVTGRPEVPGWEGDEFYQKEGEAFWRARFYQQVRFETTSLGAAAAEAPAHATPLVPPDGWRFENVDMHGDEPMIDDENYENYGAFLRM